MAGLPPDRHGELTFAGSDSGGGGCGGGARTEGKAEEQGDLCVSREADQLSLSFRAFIATDGCLPSVFGCGATPTASSNLISQITF